MVSKGNSYSKVYNSQLQFIAEFVHPCKTIDPTYTLHDVRLLT